MSDLQLTEDEASTACEAQWKVVGVTGERRGSLTVLKLAFGNGETEVISLGDAVIESVVAVLTAARTEIRYHRSVARKRRSGSRTHDCFERLRILLCRAMAWWSRSAAGRATGDWSCHQAAGTVGKCVPAACHSRRAPMF